MKNLKWEPLTVELATRIVNSKARVWWVISKKTFWYVGENRELFR